MEKKENKGGEGEPNCEEEERKEKEKGKFLRREKREPKI